ncbi:HNH endonuclease family protein [Streptomyces sp. GESEQ-4]|uniref:HNH endonuclease family protein n=1 Tax=Streptomyces sp. GESEQ-4 TaxID=2812655 RepID=UPI0027DD5841|nr:HNH endonuclease family protein [Streptomyces sp. GESEQ-4]
MSLRRHAFVSAGLLLATVTGCGTAVTSEDAKPTTPTITTPAGRSAAPGGTPGGIPLAEAVAQLRAAEEVDRDGYDRARFKHWVDADDDACDTRSEVLIDEAVKAVQYGEACELTGGKWLSYYDEVTLTEASGLDIDHMVPLEEAWASGATGWTDERREAYANDIGTERSLVAVTARTNRSKGGKDPVRWLPPATSGTAPTPWTGPPRNSGGDLAADDKELAVLNNLVEDCPDATVSIKPAA